MKIPLRPKDKDTPLDLQDLVEKCYRNGAYDGTIDYSVAPDPPLLGADKEWAENRLRELGLWPRKKAARRKSRPKSG